MILRASPAGYSSSKRSAKTAATGMEKPGRISPPVSKSPSKRIEEFILVKVKAQDRLRCQPTRDKRPVNPARGYTGAG